MEFRRIGSMGPHEEIEDYLYRHRNETYFRAPKDVIDLYAQGRQIAAVVMMGACVAVVLGSLAAWVASLMMGGM